MSTSAPAKSTPRDPAAVASAILSWGPISINRIGDVSPNQGEAPMTGATFSVKQIEADQQGAARIIIAGDVTAIKGENPGEQVPFNGQIDSGPLIHFVVEFKEVTYSFSGVVSPSFTSMAGLVKIHSLFGSADDEATWSSQARGGGQTDGPGRGEGA